MIVKLLKTLAFGMALLNAASALATGGMDGAGGGGIRRDGRYLTFGTAKVEVTPVPLKEVPGLKLLLQALNQMPMGPHKGDYFKAIYPQGERQYYKLQSLSADQHKKLMEAYLKVIGDKLAPGDQLAFYGLTLGKETFLSDEYFELKDEPRLNVTKEIQQAAVLFHESAWVLNPDLTYAQVIDLEVRFQDYLVQSQSIGRYGFDDRLYTALDRVFCRKYSPCNSSDSLQAAFIDDRAQGRLTRFLDSKGRLRLQDLLGDIEIVPRPNWFSANQYQVRAPFAKRVLMDRIVANPEVLTFQRLLAILDRMDSVSTVITERVTLFKLQLRPQDFAVDFSQDRGDAYQASFTIAEVPVGPTERNPFYLLFSEEWKK